MGPNTPKTNTSKMSLPSRSLAGILLATVLLVFFQNCEYTDKRPESSMSGNGSGYTGVRPEAGDYYAKLESGGCATTAESHFEILTVKNDSDQVLVKNECDQTSSTIPVTDLNVQDYRKELVTRQGKIYEHEMSREAPYANEVLCDFSDQKFAVLIRWYDGIYAFHVGHLFWNETSGANGFPVLRYSDFNFGNGNFGTGYMGTDFQLAVLNNYQMAEDAFAGYFNGKVDGVNKEALGLCVTTTYDCAPTSLTLSAGVTANSFTLQTASGATTEITGNLVYTGDLGALDAVVKTPDQKVYDCKGYSSKLNDELALGGCFERPAQVGQSPKRAMIQIRGKVQWDSGAQGHVDGKVCVQKNLPPTVNPSTSPMPSPRPS